MASPAAPVHDQGWRTEYEGRNEARSSGVSWPAVFAGAFVAAALSLILLALGTGIGLSAISPWASAGASGSEIGKGAIGWFILIQLIASSMGGYLAGRLRTKWVNIHTDEVYFRDTAHGFLVWAVSLVITAAFLASAAVSMVGRASQAESAASPSATGQERGLEARAYFVDMLLRSNSSSSDQNDAAVRREVGLIFANGIREGQLPPEDHAYLTHVVTARTGVSEPDATRRVDDVFAQSQQAADKARKLIAHSMYWAFLALLIGAFCASFAATIGGRQRDRVVLV
jgi:hypothetical protein